MSNNTVVLDTLKFDNGNIFLKKFHADRSFEALRFKKASVTLKEIQSIYDKIENEIKSSVGPQHILRILFHLASPLKYEVEIKQKTDFSLFPTLQIIRSVHRQSGCGPQNFKWNERTDWERLIKLKKPNADDIIALNEKGQITESSRCNLFFYQTQTEQVITPSLSSGCINGVYRRFVIATGEINLPEWGVKKIVEHDLTESEIGAYKIFAANSIRGVLPAKIDFSL